jgi:hypothetical protein
MPSLAIMNRCTRLANTFPAIAATLEPPRTGEMPPAPSKILNDLAEVFEQGSLRTAGSFSVEAVTSQTELAILPARLVRTKRGWRSSANFESRLGGSALATRHVAKPRQAGPTAGGTAGDANLVGL